MIDYRAISEAADIERVAASLGLEVDSRHNALCPFHADNKPSLHMYPDGYHCFVCGAHGDVIDLVQKLRECSKREAAEIVANISGGRLVETNYRVPPRPRTEDRSMILLDRMYDLEAAIDAAREKCYNVAPYSDVWCYYQRKIDRLMWDRMEAEGELTKMRCDSYDERQRRKQYSPAQ